MTLKAALSSPISSGAATATNSSGSSGAALVSAGLASRRFLPICLTALVRATIGSIKRPTQYMPTPMLSTRIMPEANRIALTVWPMLRKVLSRDELKPRIILVWCSYRHGSTTA